MSELVVLPASLRDRLPIAVQAYLTPLEAETAVLQQQMAHQQEGIAVLEAQVVELRARLNQHSQTSSRPPSSDPPSALPGPKLPPNCPFSLCVGRKFIALPTCSSSLTGRYREALTQDSYLEVAHRELIRCYARLAQRGHPLRHYQGLVELLRDELGAVPAPEAMALFDRLRAGAEVQTNGGLGDCDG